MTKSAAVEREALRRYVRARAPDFSAEEKRDLDAWLATDASHREEYARLSETWRRLDGLAGLMGSLRARPNSVGSWRYRLVGGLVAAGAAAVLFLALRPQAPAPLRLETAAAEHRVLKLADGTTIALDAESAIDLIEGDAPRVDLLRGDIYVDVRSHGTTHLEVRIAGAVIRDIGTRFAVAAVDNGGSVAVAEGVVELRAGTSMHMVHAGRAVRFDARGTFHEQVASTDGVAPWREQRWRFEATPLSVLAAEMARQQRIKVDIADPAVAALTVSGSFGFDEPERVLWAAAQVHGLKLKRLGERHFELQRAR